MPANALILTLIISHFSKMAHHRVHQAFIKATRLALIRLIAFDNLTIFLEWPTSIADAYFN